MEQSFAFLLSTIALIVFYAVDFLFARLLSALKQDHLELDECSPAAPPDLDPVVIVNSLWQAAAEMLEHQRRRFGLDGSACPSRNSGSYSPTPTANPSREAPETTAGRRQGVVHIAVLMCELIGPIVVVCEALFPHVFGWCRIGFPSFVQYIGVFSGIASVSLFAGRVWHCFSYSEVSRNQWLELMWFRLDFMCLTSLAAFLGAGSWVVALCLLAVGFHLAHGVMCIEKHMQAVQLETQLVRGEVDVSRVYEPGTAEAAKALVVSDKQGYSALV